MIEKALAGVTFERKDLVHALSQVDIKGNLGDISPETLADLLLEKTRVTK